MRLFAFVSKNSDASEELVLTVRLSLTVSKDTPFSSTERL
jgi:hypothetical protein